MTAVRERGKKKWVMLWKEASGCSNDKKGCQRRGCTFLAKDDRSVKISCSCFALCSIEAAVGRKMGTCKMDFSLHEYWCKVMCLERRPCSLFWWADVKACYLSLMFQIAQVFFLLSLCLTLELHVWNGLMWCQVVHSEQKKHKKRNTPTINKWHTFRLLEKVHWQQQWSHMDSWIWWFRLDWRKSKYLQFSRSNFPLFAS